MSEKQEQGLMKCPIDWLLIIRKSVAVMDFSRRFQLFSIACKKKQFFLFWFKNKINFATQSTLNMNEKHQEDLNHIRSMMERSSRFISLSGLSGVFAGICALIGGSYVYILLQNHGIEYIANVRRVYSRELITELLIVAGLVLIFALSFGIFFTIRKSKRNNLPIWTSTTKNLLFNLAVPLLVGGVFCVALLVHHQAAFVAPATLIFYGLALLNAEKYTFSDVKYLGLSEVFLGCIALFFLGKGLIFWMLGFGILHIFYGLLMFKKYK
jgi:hypothetical protein